MKEFIRFPRALFGVFICACGSYMSMQANVGLAPWEAFGMGCTNYVNLTYGNISVLTGVVIMVIDLLLKEKIGFGTILNIIFLGTFVDLLIWLNPIPKLDSFWSGVGLLLLSQLTVAIGSFFYIGAGMGAGPRDSLMVALGKRMPRVPIGIIRGIIEVTALATGWALGAKVGVGTVIAMFGISFFIQYTFKVLHFQVKEVRHDSIFGTFNKFRIFLRQINKEIRG